VADPGFDVGPRLDELTDAFVAASRRTLEWFARPLEVANKRNTGFDPVTEADRAVEDLIRAVIAERFPEHAIVGEERGRSEGEGPASSVEWIIDPIDGTRAFITGRPMWGTLIGVRIDGVPVAGWMHLPVLDQTYVGFDGRATLVEGGVSRELSTSSTTELGDAVLFSTHPSMFATEQERNAFAALEATTKLSRFDGDCANYGLLAAGFGDLVVENQLQAYDIVPLVPIIEGAGGVVTDLDGGPVSSGWAVAAANAALHEAALQVLADGVDQSQRA
jgi:histidinol phosphatase-like enzyme (inositol monophosphatase family)